MRQDRLLGLFKLLIVSGKPALGPVSPEWACKESGWVLGPLANLPVSCWQVQGEVMSLWGVEGTPQEKSGGLVEGVGKFD